MFRYAKTDAEIAWGASYFEVDTDEVYYGDDMETAVNHHLQYADFQETQKELM